MRVIREKSIDKSAFHIGKIQYALMNGDEGERLDALEDLAELTLIIGGMSLLKICTPSMPIENRTQTDCDGCIYANGDSMFACVSCKGKVPYDGYEWDEPQTDCAWGKGEE